MNDLITRIRSGDSSAWDELDRSFRPRLTAFAESRLGRGRGDDVAQDTLIGFMLGLSNYDESRSLESWLFSICAYKITDQLRRDGRRQVVQFSECELQHMRRACPWCEEVFLDPLAERPDEVLESTEQHAMETAMFYSWLRRTAERNRVKSTVIVLVCHGWRNKRIAVSLGLTEQAVASLKFDFIQSGRRVANKCGRVAN